MAGGVGGVPGAKLPVNALARSDEGALEFEESGFGSTLKGALAFLTAILVILGVFFLLPSLVWLASVGILIVAIALLVVKKHIDYYGRI